MDPFRFASLDGRLHDRKIVLPISESHLPFKYRGARLGLARPESIGLEPGDESPLLCDWTRRGQTLEREGAIEAGRVEGRIATDGAIGDGEGQNDLVRIGRHRATEKMSRREIAPQYGIRRIELHGFREISDGRVDPARQKVDDCSIPQGLGSYPLTQGEFGRPRSSPENLPGSLDPVPGLQPWRTDQTPLSGSHRSQRRRQRIAFLRVSSPAAGHEKTASDEDEKSSRPWEGKNARRPSMVALDT